MVGGAVAQLGELGLDDRVLDDDDVSRRVGGAHGGFIQQDRRKQGTKALCKTKRISLGSYVPDYLSIPTCLAYSNTPPASMIGNASPIGLSSWRALPRVWLIRTASFTRISTSSPVAVCSTRCWTDSMGSR